MPRIPPVIDAPPSWFFATIKRPKAEKPRAKPTKLMVVDIFSSRLCVLILNSGCRLGCADLLSSRASSIYKGIGKLGFQKSFRLPVSIVGWGTARALRNYSISPPLRRYLFMWAIPVAPARRTDSGGQRDRRGHPGSPGSGGASPHLRRALSPKPPRPTCDVLLSPPALKIISSRGIARWS
jgi:hypothetical protein